MIWLILACQADDPEKAPPAETAIVPAEGTWAIAIAATYEGDCALEDMSTRQPEVLYWELELEASSFTFYDDTGYPMGCTQTGDDFVCPLGSYYIDYTPSDAVEGVTSDIFGTFTTATTLTGTYEIAAECWGADCTALGQLYGADFTYPCTAVAPYTGTWGAPDTGAE